MRKKLFAFLLGIIAGTGYIGAYTFVETLTSDYLTYEFETTNHTCKIIRSKDVADGMFIDANLVLREQILWNDIYYTVTAIGENAFSSHEKLQSIQFPSTLTTIGEGAFSYCEKLKSVSFPTYCELSSVGRHAFWGCKSLTSFSFPMRLGGPIINIGAYAFLLCTQLQSVQLTYVRSIGMGAFADCSSLTSVTIPNSVTSIGDGAFSGCRSLTSLTIPESITSIGEKGFNGCTSLEIVVWNAKNCTLSSTPLFPDSPIKSFTFGPQVDTIPEYICCYNSITSVTIPENVEIIGAGNFRGCDLLETVIWNAKNCTKEQELDWNIVWTFQFLPITSFTFGSQVETIPEHICAFCMGLTSVNIPSSVTKIGEGAFQGCISLTSIEVAAGNMNYCSVNGVLFDKDKTTLIQYPLGNDHTEYVIPNSVTSIWNTAFSDCQSLTSIEIPNSVTSIGDGVFAACTNLTSVTIPNSVTSIGTGAFHFCESLVSVTIGNNVTSIGGWAFYGCSDLTAITCEATIPPVCGEDVFGEVDKSIPLYVPKESINAYKNADQWKDFTNIYAIGSSPTAISNVQGDKTIGTKILREGQIVIRRGENTFTLQGQEVR